MHCLSSLLEIVNEKLVLTYVSHESRQSPLILMKALYCFQPFVKDIKLRIRDIALISFFRE